MLLVCKIGVVEECRGNINKPINYNTNQPRKKVSNGVGGGNERGMNCFSCGKFGHKAADCRWRTNKNPEVSGAASMNASNSGASSGTGNEKQIKCYSCGKLGHKSPSCPDKVAKAIKRNPPECALVPQTPRPLTRKKM